MIEEKEHVVVFDIVGLKNVRKRRLVPKTLIPWKFDKREKRFGLKTMP